MRIRWLCVVVLVSQWSLGCATITTGTTQKILFESTPAGATATVTGGRTVQTPGELTLERKNVYDVRFEKDGYLPSDAGIRQTSNGMVLGNILIGGLIGLAIDNSSGAAYYLEPEKVSVTLMPVPPPFIGLLRLNLAAPYQRLNPWLLRRARRLRPRNQRRRAGRPRAVSFGPVWPFGSGWGSVP